MNHLLSKLGEIFSIKIGGNFFYQNWGKSLLSKLGEIFSIKIRGNFTIKIRGNFLYQN